MAIGLVNIGNTHTELCDAELGKYQKVKTNELLAHAALLFQDFKVLALATVVPELLDKISVNFSDKEVYSLDVNGVKNITFPKSAQRSLGADRLANILAASSICGSDFLIIDCGTCVTAELVVDLDFKGGFIMPGRTLQRQATHQLTGQLPLIPLYENIKVIDSDTEGAIAVGIDTLSLLGMHQWIDLLKQKYSGIKIIFTGGDACFYLQGASFKHKKIPQLTLMGLKVFIDQLRPNL